MRKLPLVVLALLALGACSKKAAGPLEQIIVRKPGDPPVAAPATASADPAVAGKQAFAASCAACHAATPDAPKGVGPTLYGVVGRKAGTVPGFAYSEAMKASDITWSEASIETFLSGPQAMVRGTSMAAGEVRSSAMRKAISAYLGTLVQPVG